MRRARMTPKSASVARTTNVSAYLEMSMNAPFISLFEVFPPNSQTGALLNVTFFEPSRKSDLQNKLMSILDNKSHIRKSKILTSK